MSQPLRLELFAELSARLTAGEKRSEVLASAKIDDAQWELSQQFWLGKMADEAGKNRLALTQKYSALYKAAVTRLAGRQEEEARRAPRRYRPADAEKVVVYAAPALPAQAAPQAPAPVVASAAAVAPPGSVAPPASVSRFPSIASPPSVSQPPSVAPPPSVSRVSHVARLTVEQLAAMRAELATAPDSEHAAVRQRFGLDDRTWELEEAHWQGRLATDKDLFARYLKSFQYCRSLLQRA